MTCFCIPIFFPFTKRLITIIALSYLCNASSCGCTHEQEQPQVFHPQWSELNLEEKKLPKDQCIFTKFGFAQLRFQVTNSQQPLHPNDNLLDCKKNIVQTDSSKLSWVLTPKFYGTLTKESFPKTFKEGMQYRAYKPDETGGIPLVFLDEWLAIDPDSKEAIFIIATGLEGKLGVSEPLKEALKSKKEKKEIQDYFILRSTSAVEQHNSCVKAGKKVFTFIHTAG